MAGDQERLSLRDADAIDAGYVSVSPLRLRLDDASAYEQLASWKIEDLS